MYEILEKMTRNVGIDVAPSIFPFALIRCCIVSGESLPIRFDLNYADFRVA
jgi:hypothetical protein